MNWFSRKCFPWLPLKWLWKEVRGYHSPQVCPGYAQLERCFGFKISPAPYSINMSCLDVKEGLKITLCLCSLSLRCFALGAAAFSAAPKDYPGGRSYQSTPQLVVSSFANRHSSHAGVQVVSQALCIPRAWGKDKRALGTDQEVAAGNQRSSPGN